MQTHFHWPDFFNEDGPIETISAVLFLTAVAIYFTRGFYSTLGFFPVILLLLFLDRELSFMHHVIANDLGWPKFYRALANMVLVAATLYTFYFIVRKKAHLLFMARAQPLLVAIILLFFCLSIAFSYEGEKMQLLWLEETTELLFALLLNYALIAAKLPPLSKD